MSRRLLVLSIFLISVMGVAPAASAAPKQPPRKLSTQAHFAPVHVSLGAFEDIQLESAEEVSAPAGLTSADEWERSDNGWKRR